MKFTFSELVADARIISAKLGAATGTPLADADVGKAVKLIATDTYGLCADGDEIEGFLHSVEPATIDGYSFGSVQVTGRKAVKFDGTVAFGAKVLCGAIVARGTALASLGAVKVKTGTAASQLTSGNYTYTERTPNTHLWRVISAAATADGTSAIIERV